MRVLEWICRASIVLLLAGSVPAFGETRTLNFDGQERTYEVYRPSGLDNDKAVPLVIMMHGGLGSGHQAERSYHWDEQADKHGFVVIYPDGLRRSWNAGGICCAAANRDNVKDLDFLTALIGEVTKAENIDPKRVYMTGMSNGGAMAYHYACEGRYAIAAIGSVSASLAYPCGTPRAISIMEIHGLKDLNIPFHGGVGAKGVSLVAWLPVNETLAAFRRANKCQPQMVQENGLVRTEAAQCAGGEEVVLITIANAGHQWPGGQKVSPLGKLFHLDPPSDAINATEKLWEFFERHRQN